MDAGVAALKQAGLASAAIHVGALCLAAPARVNSRRAVWLSMNGALATTLTVELDGEVREIDCQPGELLLSAMQREGMEPPHSCLVGSCASCMCTLVSGEVDLLHNDALDEQELSEGWTLACQAVATSDKVHFAFSRLIQQEISPNVFSVSLAG